MKAIVHDTYGPPEVLALREIARPVFGDDQVLVRVRAAAVNRPDWAGVAEAPEFAELTAREIEDVLCIYKDRLKDQKAGTVAFEPPGTSWCC